MGITTQLSRSAMSSHSVCVVMPKDSGAYTEKKEIPELLAAPLRAGEILGKISYLDADGGILAQIELTVANDIEKAAWQDHFLRIIASFLHS